MIELLGGRVHVGGHDIDAAKERAYAHQAKHGGTFVDDGENAHLIAGAGTVGLEIGKSIEDIDVLYVPMGSGSLASGTATGIKAVQPNVRVVAVQAAGAPAMVESFLARRAVERPIATRADCLVCRIPAAQALSTLIAAVDDALLVTDAEMLAAVHTYLARAHLLIELGSAAPWSVPGRNGMRSAASAWCWSSPAPTRYPRSSPRLCGRRRWAGRSREPPRPEPASSCPRRRRSAPPSARARWRRGRRHARSGARPRARPRRPRRR